jgi:uncharacterized protein YbjT (DUF2867 family)
MKILIFGASGMVGAAVLKVCLQVPMVDEVRAVTRRPLAQTHAKLRNFVHKNFLDYSGIEQAFRGMDACLFCLGISVMQVSKEEYRTITHGYTLAAAQTFKAQSPGAAFHYISGKGTDAKSRMFWAQVKARTEAELVELTEACCWRPAFIDAEPSGNTPKLYAVLRPLGVLLRPFASIYVRGDDLGKAMLQATVEKTRRRVIENREIREIAGRWNRGS